MKEYRKKHWHNIHINYRCVRQPLTLLGSMKDETVLKLNTAHFCPPPPLPVIYIRSSCRVDVHIRESESPMKRWFKHPFDIFIFHISIYIYIQHSHCFFPCLATWVQNDVSYNNVNAWNDEEEEGGESVSHSSSNGRIFHHVPGIWPQTWPQVWLRIPFGWSFLLK